jgi:hypothetical protein
MADRYWVGGTGTWNTTSTTNWSDTSGGSNGASVPTSADNVFFDSASAAGNYTVSTSTGLALACLNLTIAKAAAGNVTFIDTGTFAVAGNLDITATGVTWSAFGNWTFTAAAARTIKTDGIVLPGVTINGTGGGSWQLLSDLSTSLTGSLTLTAGTLNLNNFNLRCGAFSSNNSNVRSLQFGTGVVNLTGAGVTWNASSNTNFTMTGSRVINTISTATSGIREIQVGTWTALTAPSVNVTGGTARIVLTGSYLNLNTTGFTGQIDGGARVIYGDLTLGAGSTLQSSASQTTFSPTNITSTVTTNGITLNFPVTINGPGGTLRLGDTFTTAAVTFTLTEGTLDLNGQTFNPYNMSGTGTLQRSIITTGATFNITGNATTVWSVSSTNFTITPNSVINMTYSGSTGTRTVTGSLFTEAQAPSFNVTGGADIFAITGNIKNLTFPGFTGTLNASARTIYGNLTLNANMTCTAGAAVTTFAATSGVQTITTNGRVFPVGMTINSPGATVRLVGTLDLSTGGVAGTILTLTAGTLDLNNNILSAIAFASSNTNLRTIDFGTTGVINATIRSGTAWSVATATNFSYTGTARVNLTAAFGTTYGTRTISHGNTSGGGIATKAPPFYISGGNGSTDTITTTATSHLTGLIFTDALSILTNSTRIMYGDFVTFSGMTVTAGAAVTTFSGNTSQTFDTGTAAIDFPVTFGNGTSNGTVVLANNITIGTTRAITLTSGGLDVNGKTFDIGAWSSTNTNTRTLDIADSTIKVNNAGTVWNMGTSTGATVVSANSRIELTSTTTDARTFSGGNLTYGNLIIGGATGTSNLTISGNNTFDTISSTKTVSHTLQFIAGSTTTVENFTVSGSEGNMVTITSTTNAQHNLVITGADTVDTVGYLNISYSNASPTGRWLAGNGSVRGSTVTGWIFEQTGNWLTMF